jgi:tetratricopeptide (TPR) repeat protein
MNAQSIARAETVVDALNSANRQTGKEKTPEERLALYEKALTQGSLGEQETVEQLYQYASSIGGSELGPDIKEEAYALASRAGEEFSAIRPGDARVESFAGILNAQFGKLDEALIHLRRAAELSPDKQSILFQLGEVLLRRGEIEEALSVLRRAFEVEPSYDTARVYYAGALYYTGRTSEADALLVERFGTTQVDNDQLLQVYRSLGLHDRVINIWRLRIENDPENTDLYLNLASAYFASGDTPNTILTLRRVSELNPAMAAQVEQVISQLESGVLIPQ